MEIQTFMLCKELRQTGEGSSYDANMVGLHSFHSLDGEFPLTFRTPYYMLVRRPERGADKTVTLRFNLIDMDGKAVGAPQNANAVGTFPGGFLFMVLAGTIEFSFPRIADYRLDITADEETVYQYNIEVTLPPDEN